MIVTEKVIRHRAKCDSCGTYCNYADTENGAYIVAIFNHGWISTIDGELICEDCKKKRPSRRKR